MKLDRRWWIASVLVVVVAGGLAVSQMLSHRPSEECRPVLDLLDFSKAQGELIAAKSDESTGIPSVADDTAYVAWADGLAERSGKVTSPELAQRAVQVADLASKFVAKLPVLRSQTEARAPGAPAPPVAYEMSALNDRITDELTQLSAACSR